MSHYACLVIMPEGASEKEVPRILEQIMEPYMENCCGTPDKRYMKFYDKEDEYREKYEKESIEKVVLPSGKLVYAWDEQFKPKPTKKEPFPKAEVPKELERRMVPYKELYSSFEDFMEQWAGYSKDETYNRYGYWQNPRAKWDWYEIGGRWSGFFKLKPKHPGGTGKQYNYGVITYVEGGKADLCFKGSVDFETMRRQAEELAAKRYDFVRKAIKGLPEAESWEMVKSGFDLKEPDNIEKARKKYHEQPRVKAFRELNSSEEGREMFSWMAGVEEYQVPREQYLNSARNHAAVPFAVLKDGKWYEQGEMGWWGMASNEKDPETWNSMVSKLYDDLPDDTLFVLVDCHI